LYTFKQFDDGNFDPQQADNEEKVKEEKYSVLKYGFLHAIFFILIHMLTLCLFHFFKQGIRKEETRSHYKEGRRFQAKA